MKYLSMPLDGQETVYQNDLFSTLLTMADEKAMKLYFKLFPKKNIFGNWNY